MSRDNQTFAAFFLSELRAAAAGTAALFYYPHRGNNQEFPYQVFAPSWNVRGKMFERVDAFHVQIRAPMKSARFSKMILGTSCIVLRDGKMRSRFKSCLGVTTHR
jgi:hypothetical protein